MQQSEVCELGDFARYWQLDEKVGGDVNELRELVRPRPGKGLVGFNAS